MICVKEQGFRSKVPSKRFRPFQEGVQVKCRGYSKRLQRILVDFGADHSFAQASEKVLEHYGIEVPTGAVREKTLSHAKTMEKQPVRSLEERPTPGVETLISQTDGTMVPLVSIRSGQGDGRKRREVFWQEAITTLAYPQGSISPIYAATLQGRDEAGFLMKQVALEAGLGTQTFVHAVGDGASWIAEKVGFHFGTQARYLIDFYHLGDYLHQAVESTPVGNKASYLGRLRSGFKQGRGESVIQWLKPFEEPASRPNSQAPIRAALRYVENRPGQFEYQQALAHKLPIGSGEIESSHRHVIQKRLKIPGAWWQPRHANSMLHLRVLRANKHWNLYWNSSVKVDETLSVSHTLN